MTDARELLIRLDRDAHEPLTSQLRDALRDAVRSGKLRPGARLPASRTLAEDLGVSRGVVVEAYEQLVAEGYLTGRAGGGTRVTAATAPEAGARHGWHRQHAAGPPAVLDVRPGAPDLGTFPRSAWEMAVRRALRDAADAELGYAAPWGSLQLREQLAAYLGRVRGTVASAETVVITSGATQALTVLTRTLVRRGHRLLAVEDPSNAVQRDVLGSHGVQIVDVPTDSDGIAVTELARTGARAVLVTPAHQFPSGVLMSPRRRAELLDWARAVDGVVIEDDYDAEFRYDGRSMMCLQGDDPMRVALVGSLSKTLAPALRLGWVIPPMGLVDAVAETKRDDDFGSETIGQLAFAHLLDSGRYDRHLRMVRRLYGRRRAALVAELGRRLPSWTVSGLAAGQHLTLELPAGLDEAAVVEHARRRGVLVLGMSSMRGRPGGPALVVSFARIGGSMPGHVADVLAGAARDAETSPPPPPPEPPPGRTDLPQATVNAQDFWRHRR